MRQDDLLGTYMNILYLAMFIGTLVCGTANVASAAIISQDYVVTINPENVDRYGSADRYFNDQPTLQISSGDTFKGTIKLQGGQFLPKRNVNLHAEFYLSNHPNIRASYDFTGLMYLIDDAGNDLTRSSFFDWGSSFFTSIRSGYNQNTNLSEKVAGMRFEIKFSRLSYWNKAGPVDVRLGRISATPFASNISAVPEPSTWAMMMLGMAGVGLAMRRRRASASVVHA